MVRRASAAPGVKDTDRDGGVVEWVRNSVAEGLVGADNLGTLRRRTRTIESQSYQHILQFSRAVQVCSTAIGTFVTD